MPSRPILVGMPDRWTTGTDELYRNITVAPDVIPLYRAPRPETGSSHLVAWARESGGGRVFATTLGHSADTQDLEAFETLVARGLRWATHHLDDRGQVEPGFEGCAPSCP